MRTPCAFLLLASIFLSSCAGVEKAGAPSLRASLRPVRENTEKRSAVSGTGSISWVDPERNVAAPGVVLAEWPDKFRLEVQDPIGGLQALLILNGEKFWWYASEQKEIVTGPVTHLGRVVGIPFSSQDLVRGFLARPAVARWYEGELRDTHSAVIEPGPEILEWSDRLNEPVEWRREAGNRSVAMHFEDYVVRFGASFPEKVRLESVKNGEREQTISWVWREWQPTVQNGKKLFQIPQEQRFGRKIKTLP